MPSRSINTGGVGRAWAMSAALAALAGCPGYLDPEATIDAGGYVPTPQAVQQPQPQAYPPAGGASGTPTGGTGGGVAQPPNVARNTGGTGGRRGVDAGRPGDAQAAAMPPPGGVPCYAPAEVQSRILTPKCALCHGVSMPAGGLDLVTPGSKARILNAPAKGCPGKTLATPAGTGHFFDKLGGAIAGCGSQMPFGGIAPLNAAEIQCLRDWIKPPTP